MIQKLVIVAWIINTLKIWLKVRKFWGKIRTAFGEIDSQLLKFWLLVESSKEYAQKMSRQHFCLLIFPRYLIPSTEQMVEQISLAYDPLKETVTVVKLFYIDTKAMVRSPNGNSLTLLLESCNKHHFYSWSAKIMISSRNYYWWRLRRWTSASCKYMWSSRIFATQPGTGRKRHRSLRELGGNRVHVF